MSDIRRLTPGITLAFLLAVAAFSASPVSAQPDDKPDQAGRAGRLEKMTLSAEQYALFAGNDRRQPLKFVEAPIMRWANLEYAARDGTVFLWTRHGRPQAILGLFTYDDDHFSHEWQSLSSRSLTADRAGEVVWSPSEPGINFAVLAEVDAPAETTAARLRQMKALAARFSSTFVGFAENQNPIELRLLPQPLYRYETGDDLEILDGALFAFVQGTDPQALLVLEAHSDGKMRRWEFAFARMASGAVAARFGDKEVYSVLKYDFQRDPRRPFLLLRMQPVPDK